MTNEIPFSPEDYVHLFSQLLELGDFGIIGMNKKGTIKFANSAIAELLGYEREALAGRKVFELEQGLNLITYRNRWEAMEEKHRSWKVIWTTSSGHRLKLEITGQVLDMLSSPIICWKVAMPASAAGIASIAGQLEIGIWQWDLVNGQFTFSDNFLALLALGESDLPDPKQLNIVSVLKACMGVPDFKLLLKNIKQVQSVKASFQQNFTVGHSGRTLALLGEPVQEGGTVSRIRGLLIPSFQSQQENGLARQMIDQSDAMICWIAPDCSLIYVNDAICEKLGYDRKAMLQEMEITDIDAEHTRKQWEDIWDRVSDEQTIQIESTFKTAKERVFPVEYFLNYLDTGAQKLISLSARNITERRQKEAKLQMSMLEVKTLSEQLEAENIYLKEEVTADYNFENILTRSPEYKKVLKKVEQVAPTDATVLIMGETGTGKELLAHAIHNLSPRKGRSMVKVNCAALSEELMLSELFGHEKGAFTGAASRKIGRFELAHKSTLLLDEIGEVSMETQTKLLRVLQEGEFERVGGVETIQTDVRIVAATNRDLKKMVREKEFREDLYYRLQVFPILNLPLRERNEDIPLLVQHFMEVFSKKHRKNLSKVRSGDMKSLQQHDFPGNIRELMNIIEQAVVISQGEALDLSYWEPMTHRGIKSTVEIFPTMEEMQRQHILDALNKTKWKVSGEKGAAELLGLKGQTLFSKMRKLGIRRTD